MKLQGYKQNLPKIIASFDEDVTFYVSEQDELEVYDLLKDRIENSDHQGTYKNFDY